MVIVQFIEDRLFSVGDEPLVRWYLGYSSDDANVYVKEELAKIGKYNKDEDMVTLHRTGSYMILTPEQVKGFGLYEIDTMPIGMLFKIMSHNYN